MGIIDQTICIFNDTNIDYKVREQPNLGMKFMLVHNLCNLSETYMSYLERARTPTS